MGSLAFVACDDSPFAYIMRGVATAAYCWGYFLWLRSLTPSGGLRVSEVAPCVGSELAAYLDRMARLIEWAWAS
jgi:hypothetical protein